MYTYMYREREREICLDKQIISKLTRRWIQADKQTTVSKHEQKYKQISNI